MTDTARKRTRWWAFALRCVVLALPLAVSYVGDGAEWLFWQLESRLPAARVRP